MNRRVRFFALSLLAVILLIANGLLAPVAYTFALGEAATAKIVSCETAGKSGTVCRGQWERSSTPESGEVIGAGFSDEGSSIAIRTSALGTYTDNFHAHFWVRSLMAIAVDGGLFASLLWMRHLIGRGAQALVRLRADSDPSTRLFTYEANRISELDGAHYFTTEDVDSRTTRLLDPFGTTVWTFHGESRPGEFDRITVSRDGIGHGHIERRQSSLVTHLYGPHGDFVGAIAHQRQYGVPGHSVTAADGREVALTAMGGKRLVARIPRDAPDWWRNLIFAHMVVGRWLALPKWNQR